MRLTASSVTLDHSIVAGNSATDGPDCYGTMNSGGYNCIGDTTDCTIVGDQTGNLYDVDPLFTDPDGPDDDPDTWEDNDYSLQPASPCVDAGDPALVATGQDVARNPRLLDGNLDGVMVVDMGAYEFNNVHLAVTGNPTPGGTLTIDLTGRVGLSGWLWLGTASGEIPFSRFGALFLDLSSPWWLFPIAIPASLPGTIPMLTPEGQLLVFQVLGVQNSNGAGNLSNVVEVVIQ